MKKNSEYIKFIFIGLGVLIIAYSPPFIIPPKISDGINDLSYWYVYSFSKKSAKPLRFIGIEIDDYCLNKIPQRWPWKRSIYAQIIRILDEEKVKTIGIDFAFVGESESKLEDDILATTLKDVKSRVVLAHHFDYQKRTPILPLKAFLDSAYSAGMINTPEDRDRKTRRLRAFIEYEDKFLYSFAVQLSSAFLDRSPKAIVFSIPLLKDKTFLINYLFKPNDILRVNFLDILENLQSLKQKYGQDFLKDALVLIYPAAEIFHDTYLTPLDYIPGGILHLNGVANIVLNRFINESKILSVIFLGISFLFILYFLVGFGFIYSLLLVLGLFVFIFWILVILSLNGIRFDYFQIVFSGSLFFISGSIYKYIYFLSQLLKIKSKATLDPLRNLFTLRYFSYRLELALREIHFNKDLFLLFIYFESLKDKIETFPIEKIKEIWQRIHSIIWQKESFWALYSNEEVIGVIVSSPKRIDSIINYLENNLGFLFKDLDIKSRIKLAYLKFKKNYPVKELSFVLSKNLKETSKDVLLLKDEDLAKLLSSYQVKIKEKDKFLESLDEDIEEKNRQLLLLIENLNKEYAKTKEVFFEVITSLVNALEARDPYTKGHSERVAEYSLRLAQELGWSQEQKEKLRKAALLHDLGKIGIPDTILHKRGKLNDEEYDFIKKHELFTVRILEPLKEFSEILPWILYHHERWDGKGYPHGLAGDAIPLASQIISIADVFDALVTGRDYKQAFTHEEAIGEIIRNKGTQFNLKLVDIFVSAFQEKGLQK